MFNAATQLRTTKPPKTLATANAAPSGSEERAWVSPHPASRAGAHALAKPARTATAHQLATLFGLLRSWRLGDAKSGAPCSCWRQISDGDHLLPNIPLSGGPSRMIKLSIRDLPHAIMLQVLQEELHGSSAPHSFFASSDGWLT